MSKEKPFTLLCTVAELKNQVRICKRSEYTVTEYPDKQILVVMDGNRIVLSAQAFGGLRLVKLYPRYYTHPFGNRRTRKRGGDPP